jgi:uncharacterized protein (DUF433 family)
MQPIVSDTGYRHILMMKDGRAMIAGTRIKVELIVIGTNHHKLTPEEICKYWPDLTLGQVHSALAYYYDNKDEVERLIKEGEEFVEKMRRQNEPHQRKMRELVQAERKRRAKVKKESRILA